MAYLSSSPGISGNKPLFCSILANTLLSTVPGISGAGPSAEKTLLTPVLDAELVTYGRITSMPVRPNTPTGCPTPASITRAIMDLCGLSPLFLNAGLVHPPTVPCLDVYGQPGRDPRVEDAVPDAEVLYLKGRLIGSFLDRICDLLILGECVPGGTTTALCVLRALGYPAQVSSSFADNPVMRKEEIWLEVERRLGEGRPTDPLAILQCTGDPMMPVAAGIVGAFTHPMVLAGGTQMLAVAAICKTMGLPAPLVVTTCYVRDDPSANFAETASQIGVSVTYVDPEFGEIGHSGLARYCIGEVKEGMGAGGAMFLAYLLGHSPDAIRAHIFETVRAYE